MTTINGLRGFVKSFISMDDMLYSVPEPEEWEMDKIPPGLISAWDQAHETLELFERRPSINRLDTAIRAAFRFLMESRKISPSHEFNELETQLRRLESSTEHFDNAHISRHQNRIVNLFEKIIANTHLLITKSLAVPQGAWYHHKDRHKPLSRKDI